MEIHKRGLIKYLWFLKTGLDKIFDEPSWLKDQHREIDLQMTSSSRLEVKTRITGTVAVDDLKTMNFWVNPRLGLQFNGVEAEVEVNRLEVSNKPDAVFPIRLTKGMIHFKKPLPRDSFLSVELEIQGTLRPGSLADELPWGITNEAALLKDELMWLPFMGKSALYQFITNRFTFEMTMNLPSEWTAAATGVPNLERLETFTANDFAVHGISIMAQKFEGEWESFTSDGLRYWLRIPPSSESGIVLSKREMMEAIIQVGGDLTAIWGKPKTIKDVVVCFIKTNFGGFCSGNFVTLDVSAGKNEKRLIGNLAHELCHLWWNQEFSLADVKMIWAGEGIPEFMSYYLERRHGFGDDLSPWEKHYKPKPLRKLRPLFDFRDNMLTRTNPVIALHRLERKLGESRFQEFLKGLGRRFQEHPVTWHHFVAVFADYHDDHQDALQVLKECGF